MRKVMASMLAMGVFVAVSVAQQSPSQSRPAVGMKPAPSQSVNETRTKPTPKTPNDFVNELDKVVGLSADQKVKAKTFAENRQKQMKSLRDEAKSGAEKDVLRQKRMQLHKEQKAELAKILTPEQSAKWETYRKEQRAQHNGGPTHHRTAEQQLSDLDAVVSLTADQKTKVKSLLDAKSAKMKALMEEQKNNADEKVLKEKRQQIRKEYHAELDKVLTAEQKAKLKAHHEQMKANKTNKTFAPEK